MKKLLFLLPVAAVALATSLSLTPSPRAVAQIAPAPVAPSSAPGVNFACLRGMSYFYTDVTSTSNAPDEADLRNDLRDTIELELRRAGIIVRTPSPSETAQNVGPFLRLNVKWERNTSRAECVLELTVQDRVSILRNREQVTAVIFEMQRPVNIRTEQAGAREIRIRARELIREFVNGAKKYN